MTKSAVRPEPLVKKRAVARRCDAAMVKRVGTRHCEFGTAALRQEHFAVHARIGSRLSAMRINRTACNPHRSDSSVHPCRSSESSTAAQHRCARTTAAQLELRE